MRLGDYLQQLSASRAAPAATGGGEAPGTGNAFDLAARQIGLNERDQRAALTDYLQTGGVNLDPASLAWCAAFVNSTLTQSGMEGTGSNMARSFLEWGQPVDEPQRGDIAVFSRGDPDGPYGHVGFFDGYNPDGTLRILGGNQGDAVSIDAYGTDRLLGFRRAPVAGGAPATGGPGPIAPPGNALAGMAPPAPQNALSAYQPPPPPSFGGQMDVTPFLRPLAPAAPAFGFQPGQSPFL